MTLSTLAGQEKHDLMRLIRKRVEAGYPMTMIAAELGYDVDDICAWIMAYREPKRHRYVNRASPADLHQPARTVEQREAAKFAAWKRQHDGAARTRRGLG